MQAAHIVTVAVCGIGNEAHVFASYAASRGRSVCLFKIKHEHDLLRPDPDSPLTITAQSRGVDGLSVCGSGIVVSNIAKEAVEFADIVIIPVPSNALELYLSSMAPYIKEGTIIAINAQTGSCDWVARRVLGAELYDSLVMLYLLDMPWACRVQEAGISVAVLGTKAVIDVVVYPTAQTGRTIEVFSSLFGIGIGEGEEEVQPALRPVGGILAMSLTISAVIHCGIIYGRFKNWDGVSVFPELLLFYEGVDEQTTHILEEMGREGMAVLEELGRRFPLCVDASRDGITLLAWLRRAYPTEIDDSSCLLSCLTTNRAYKGLSHAMTGSAETGYKPDVTARYWTEDLPCHLLLAKGMALLLGNVETPLMDAVIEWMQGKMGAEYLLDGGLTGRDMQHTCAPQQYGLELNDIFSTIRMHGHDY
jgi:hypothetical protein